MKTHLWRLALAGVATLSIATPATSKADTPIRNIVLVHGAFVDGSGWRPVYDILARDGYRVTIVQQPLTGLDEDVAATNRALDALDGPAILVGHSYGGAIITEAGTNAHVAGLVYIAAHAPDEGETETGNGQRYPSIRRTSTQNSPPTCPRAKPSSRRARRCRPRPRCSPRRSPTRRGG